MPGFEKLYGNRHCSHLYVGLSMKLGGLDTVIVILSVCIDGAKIDISETF